MHRFQSQFKYWNLEKMNHNFGILKVEVEELKKIENEQLSNIKTLQNDNQKLESKIGKIAVP